MIETTSLAPNYSTKWLTKVELGKSREDNKDIYLDAPQWDCDWYWSFGYLGNKNCHYHLSGYQDRRNINMYDALKADYILNPKIEDNLWLFCELSLTIYSLKETAEILGRGGSYMTTNPLASIIKNTDEVLRLNSIVIPACLDKLFEIIS